MIGLNVAREAKETHCRETEKQRSIILKQLCHPCVPAVAKFSSILGAIRLTQGSVIYLVPGQVVCFEKRREYFPVGSTPASLPARLSKQTTRPFTQSLTCLDDVVLTPYPFAPDGFYQLWHNEHTSHPKEINYF